MNTYVANRGKIGIIILPVDLHPKLPSLCMQELPHLSVAQSNIVKQFDCCSRGNSECKYMLFLVQISLQMHTVAILDAHKFDCQKHLYVAITRACKKLVIFTENVTLSPYKDTRTWASKREASHKIRYLNT